MFIQTRPILLVILLFCCVSNIESWSFKVPKINSYNPYCVLKECCNEDWIKFNKTRLIKSLREKVYGQPLLETAVDAISSHLNPNFPPKKPLTLSFHGMTGTGKNYVSKFITESMFLNGVKSKYVHNFIGRMHFSDINKLENYKNDLFSWLKGNLSDCATRLFIFDEVDKMIPGILNGLKPLLDYRDEIEGVTYSKSIFVFLSNTGADVIREHYHELYVTEGKNREDLKISDFETFIQTGAFNEPGGFQQSDTIKNNLIDHYIPFLPLEEKHVIMCIEDEFKSRRVLHPLKEHINEVMKFIDWGPDSSRLFSKTGCKRIGQKVAILVEKYYTFHSSADREEL